MDVLRLPMPIEIPATFKEESGHWGNTFDKIHLFGLTKFSKLVYLDSDMIVLKNIDVLFEKPHLSAVAAGQLEHPDWTRLNSGLMVIEPEENLAQKIGNLSSRAVIEVQALGGNKIGDQDVINAYYADWPDRKDLHLDEGYNIFFTDLDVYIGQHGYRTSDNFKAGLKDINVIHFVGAQKPWMKWANLKHLVKIYKSKKPYQLERKYFLIYLENFKRLTTFKNSK